MKKIRTIRKDYIVPKIKKVKVQKNFFLSNNSRFTDSLNELLDIGVYAASGGCGGSSSSKADVCFLPHTKITLSNKEKKNIDSIEIGEKLLSFDTNTKKFEAGIVKHREHHQRKDGYYIINHILHVTDDHPLWVNNNGWKKVKDIKVNDFLQDESNEQISINSIEYISKEVVVYNIQVQGNSTTYFAEGILANSYRKT